jgi:hypothetical protein
MNRHLRGAMWIALGILLGVASSSFQQSRADPPADDSNGRGNAAVVAELKEIKSQLKDINVFLHTGVVRNFAVMNPPPDRAAPDQ